MEPNGFLWVVPIIVGQLVVAMMLFSKAKTRMAKIVAVVAPAIAGVLSILVLSVVQQGIISDKYSSRSDSEDNGGQIYIQIQDVRGTGAGYTFSIEKGGAERLIHEFTTLP